MDDKAFELIEKLYVKILDIETNMVTKQDLSRVEEKVTCLEQNVGRLEQNVGRLEQNVGRLEQNLVRLECDLGGKIDALFDGYKANTEALQELKGKVENHEVRLQIVK